jgi:hypothetical protein
MESANPNQTKAIRRALRLLRAFEMTGKSLHNAILPNNVQDALAQCGGAIVCRKAPEGNGWSLIGLHDLKVCMGSIQGYPITKCYKI